MANTTSVESFVNWMRDVNDNFLKESTMKLNIEKVFRKEVGTKYGKKWKVSYKMGDTWYNAWEGAWNSRFNEGDTIDLEEIGASVESREYNGKTYYDIKGPKNDYRAPSNSSEVLTELKDIKSMVIEILKATQRDHEPGEDIPF